MKRIVVCILLLLAAVLGWLAAAQAQQAVLAEKLLRLHVVANSDSEYDQALKLLVRDAVLDAAGGLSDRASVEAALPRLQAAAEAVSAGQQVTVTLGYEEFPTRVYGSFSLPAGVYPTLRVTLGEGKGHNWWCVVFPSLCLRAASEVESVAVAAGFTEEEVTLITEEPYSIKFKTLELIQKFRRWLGSVWR